MSDAKKPLRIGDIASLTGTAASTLRFWEEQGIAAPEKDFRNQYRRYTPDDSCRFLFAKRYRSFGVSLPEVPALLSADGAGRTAVLETRREAVNAELRRLEILRAALDRHLAERDRARRLLGRFEFEKLASYRFFSCVEGGRPIADCAETAEAWLRELPAVDFALLIDPSRSSPGKTFTCRWGYGAEESGPQVVSDRSCSWTAVLPARAYAATAVLRETARDFTETEYRALLEGLAAAGGTLDGPILGRILESEGAEDSARYLILLFLPIKE